MAAMLDAWAWWAAGTLFTASVQGTVTVVLIWLLCRRVTTLAASTRALLWWVAALGFIVALIPLPSLRVPLLPAPPAIVPIPVVQDVSIRALRAATSVPFEAHDVETANASHRSPGSRWWVIAAIALWITGLATHVVRLVSAYVRLRGVLRRSTTLPEDEGEMASRIAAAVGLQRSPRIRMSEEIATPLVAGLVRATVLIPASAIASLSRRERAMAIGHELAHIRRRDLLFGWVPAIVERLFFFHPLARLAAREYAAERESACDALVIDTMDVAPHEYGGMLVRLGIAGANPAFTMGGSPLSVASLRRRLDMLHDATSTRSSRTTIALVTLIAMLAVLPLRVVARTPAPSQNAAAPAPPAAAQTPAKPAPPVKPQPAAPVAPGTTRANATNTANLDRAIAEQRRDLQRIEEALQKLSEELETLHTRQRESQFAQQSELARAQENMRRMLEVGERAQQFVGNGSERELTMQFLENRLSALTAEHEQTSARLGQLSAEINSIRQKIDEARRAQEIESSQKRGDEKK